MDDKLLVRLYNVGLGDCIYVRVPDRDGAKHLLIDCGNKYGTEEDLKAAIADLKERLPEVPGEPGARRLDLLVATHAHEDHVRGFDAELFAGLRIERLWMSVAMDPEHPQAEEARELAAFALEALERLRLSDKPGLAQWAESTLALSKGVGMKALRTGIPAGVRRYVHADSPAGELALFDDPAITLRVLAPMKDIDRFYLGRETPTALRGFRALRGGEGPPADAAPGGPAPSAQPANVSREDFALLRQSLTDQVLAFVLKAGELVKNTSVVLLLEWRGRRLLFTGDAEAKTANAGAFQEDGANGSWNVLWHRFREELSRPVDFLKVGHHGSFNATPWTAKTSAGGPHPINAILDSLLPLPAAGEAPERFAVVSTARTRGYPTIPDPSLMVELGRRVANASPYREPADLGHAVPAGKLQPQRTDLEARSGRRVPWIELEFAPRP
jgi:beta-lactamase superfamily II metal-dependent hydrolase